MVMKNDGRKSNSKKTKKDKFENNKEKKCRCSHCNERFAYSSEDITIPKTGSHFVTCIYCNYEVEIK